LREIFGIISNNFSLGRSHYACGTRERLRFYALSLSLNKERAKENQPKAAAFGNRLFPPFCR